MVRNDICQFNCVTGKLYLLRLHYNATWNFHVGDIFQMNTYYYIATISCTYMNILPVKVCFIVVNVKS